MNMKAGGEKGRAEADLSLIIHLDACRLEVYGWREN